MVALEWMDVEPLIGCKVSDYIIQHKRVEDPSEAEVYTGEEKKIQKYNCLDLLLCSTTMKTASLAILQRPYYYYISVLYRMRFCSYFACTKT